MTEPEQSRALVDEYRRAWEVEVAAVNVLRDRAEKVEAEVERLHAVLESIADSGEPWSASAARAALEGCLMSVRVGEER